MPGITYRRSFSQYSCHESAYANSLHKCSNPSYLQKGASLHAHSIKTSFLTSIFVSNHLLNMYSRCHLLTSTLSLFNQMPFKNSVSWSSLLLAHLLHGLPLTAVSIFSKIRPHTSINDFSVVATLDASSSFHDPSLPPQLFCVATRLGFLSNMHVNNAFLSALIRQGKTVEAAEAFDTFPQKDTVSWNTMITAYSQSSCPDDIPSFWRRMRREGVHRDGFSFSNVLTVIAALPPSRIGAQVHGELVKHGHGCEICVGNSLVDMYLKTHSLAHGLKAFNEMCSRDVVSWTQMATGFLNWGEPGGALDAISEMKSTGMKPNKFTLATAFSACAGLPSLSEGVKAHVCRIKLGKEADVCTDNSLLDMYTKCGCMGSALKVFRCMGERNVVSWTTMITGYTLNGDPRRSVEIFEEMKEAGVDPNYVTFICVLYACSQGGFLEEGWRYFSGMGRDHGVMAGEDHYVCMVDMMCRGGEYVEEAEELIVGMPLGGSAVLLLVWQILLSGYLSKGDSEGAVRAGKKALGMDRKNPLTYILLSNMFAGLNRWDGVGALRKIMGCRYVKKTPASSWLEMGVNPVVSNGVLPPLTIV